MNRSTHKRSWKNFLLEPLLQTKIGIYAIGLTILLLIGMGLLMFWKLNELAEIILSLTDSEEEVMTLLRVHMTSLSIWVLGVFLVYMTLVIIISVIYTHRLIGPAIAFERQIKDMIQGNYGKRIVLRQSDYFNHIAVNLNQLAEVLEKKDVESKEHR